MRRRRRKSQERSSLSLAGHRSLALHQIRSWLAIGPLRACATVRHAERAVVSGAYLEPMTRRLVEIRNVIVRVVLSAFGQRLVQLPHVLEAHDLSQVSERVA